MKDTHFKAFLSFLALFVAQMLFCGSDVSLKDTEARANDNSGETQTGQFNKEKGNCTKTFIVDASGYVYIRGRKIKVASGQTTYTQTVTDAQIDCPVGTKFTTCKECSCSNYWNSKC